MVRFVRIFFNLNLYIGKIFDLGKAEYSKLNDILWAIQYKKVFPNNYF